MQTFMPYPDFKETASSLDMKRLGKQRVEAMQILQVLAGMNKTKAWTNHPAVKMWHGYEAALAQYAYAICDEWIGRGYKDTCKEKIKEIIKSKYGKAEVVLPRWIGNNAFHRSHKSNLIRKKPEWYEKMFGKMPNDLPYIWPSN